MWQKSRGARFPWHFVTYEVCTTHTEVDLKLMFFTQLNNCGILVNCQKVLLQYFLTDHIDRLYRHCIQNWCFSVKCQRYMPNSFYFWILNFSLEIHLNIVRWWEGASVRKVASWSPLLLLPKFSQQSSMIPDTGYRLFFLYSKDWKCSNPVLVNFRNYFYHTLPAPEFGFRIFPSPSRMFGVDLLVTFSVPKLPKMFSGRNNQNLNNFLSKA